MTRSYTKKAMRSFFGARKNGEPRNQDINTPQFLIDAILELWPDGIKLDPCSNKTSKIPAVRKLYPPDSGFENMTSLLDGLTYKWPDFTYANPPYNKLKDWLAKPVPGREHLLLAPCRPNRRWYCEAIGTFPVTCWLKPFPFDGHKQAYPTPLGLSYWGTRIKEFNRIFSRYGVVGRMIINV